MILNFSQTDPQTNYKGFCGGRMAALVIFPPQMIPRYSSSLELLPWQVWYILMCCLQRLTPDSWSWVGEEPWCPHRQGQRSLLLGSPPAGLKPDHDGLEVFFFFCVCRAGWDWSSRVQPWRHCGGRSNLPNPHLQPTLALLLPSRQC